MKNTHYYVNYINDSLMEILGAKNFLKVVDSLNYNHFIKLCQHLDWTEEDLAEFDISFKNIIKFFFNMGGLSKPITETRDSKVKKIKEGEEVKEYTNKITETTDYAHKLCEFLKQNISGPSIYPHDLDIIASHMNVDGVKPQFTKFFLNKESFVELLTQHQENQNFVAKCYNQFEDIQQLHRTNKGKQRQLAPTVEHFIAYFKAQVLANNYSEEDRELVKKLTKYYYNAQTINMALDIVKEREKNKIPKGIVAINLEELNKVNELIEKCENINAEFIKVAKEIETYFYSWVPKDAIENLYLAREINCSHIEALGGGIAEASMLHPNVQTLAIKNSAGKIIGKATVYVNREEEYAVFNTFGISKSTGKSHNNEIYQAFMRGVNDFVTQYDAENPERKLKIVTIGMNMNDLWTEIRANHKKSKIIYKSIDYSSDRNDKWRYSGDSDYMQYILYEADRSFKLGCKNNKVESEKEE